MKPQNCTEHPALIIKPSGVLLSSEASSSFKPVITMIQRRLPLLIGLVVLVLLGPGRATAQDSPDAERFFPRQGFMLSGYGGAGYNAVFADGERPNNFSVIFAPILLYQISDRFLFEGEFEFEFEEGVTMTELEYAQVDVSISNNFTVMAGKFLLPFNTFSERTHPVWINRFVSPPALYGAHGSATPTDPLLPVLSDIGVQLRGAFSTGRFSTVTAEVFVTQGPILTEEEHDEEEEEVDGHGDEEGGFFAAKTAGITSGGSGPGDLAFGSNASDNNEDKMVGGRIGFGVAPYFEVNVSGMTGAYDDTGDLRFSALGVHLEGRFKSFTLHSEFIQTWQDLAEEEDHAEVSLAKNQAEAAFAPLNEGATETLSRNGYWIQLGYRRGKWQPVVRWTQLFEGEIDGETVAEAGRQLALGLDYWFEPALALKVEYLINNEEEAIDNNRFAIQLAFGF